MKVTSFSAQAGGTNSRQSTLQTAHRGREGIFSLKHTHKYKIREGVEGIVISHCVNFD